MKKFLVSATTAAVLSVLSSGALAVVSLDDGTGSVNYAKELVVAGTTNLTGSGSNVTSTLGFGVSNGQTRFIRYDLTNATFGAAVLPANLVMANTTATVAQGGALGSTFVIFQITATADIDQSVAVGFNSGSGPGLVIQSAGAPVRMAYSLYEDAPSAAAGGAAGRLNSNFAAQTVAGLVTGLAFTTTPNTSTADVAANPTYTQFVGPTSLATIGTVSLGAATPVLDPVSGAQVLYAALVANGTSLVLKGDFSAAQQPSTNSAGVFLGPDNGVCPAAGTAPTPATPVDSATFATNATPVVARPLCFSVTANNQVKIAAQTFTVEAAITPAANSTAANLPATTAGMFVRNGTVLKASFAETTAVSGVARAVSLVNTSGVPAPYTVRCMVNSPNPVAGTPGTVLANGSTRVSLGTPGLGCPTNGTLRGVELTFAVPQGSVIGSIVSQSLSTGQASFDGMTGNQ